MFSHIEKIKNLLSEDDTALLKQIYEPTVVGIPPENTWHLLCVMPDGEIRAYGSRGKVEWKTDGYKVYQASRDGGLSWKTYIVHGKDTLCNAGRSRTGRYMAIEIREYNGVKGVYSVVSDIGPGDEHPTIKLITTDPIFNMRIPQPLQHSDRMICPAQATIEGKLHPVIFISDDDGETWRYVIAEAAEKHKITPPHKGLRWQNYACEPTIVELSTGRLMMLARTSQDYHYVYYSDDFGDTWTKPVPSRFHGTLTTPTLHKLSDGRILFLWCNTQPLPELDHTRQWPVLLPVEIDGEGGEDVFTNRDANHAAITEDDGDTWLGFREMALNPIRNDSDFRTKGANDSSLDKSIHQFQALELPYNKVLVSYGQHPESRRLIIFDLNWLYETERRENFRTGLTALSTQVYLKSVSGNYRGFSGHCAWNRTNGAVLVPDPAGDFTEALKICRVHDERLFSDVQGAVWNFPAAQAGTVTVKMKIEGDGLRLSLTDRWFNPIDEVIAQDAQVTYVVKKDQLPGEDWTDVKIVWDLEKGLADVFAGEARLAALSIEKAAPDGLSYLHLQSSAQTEDLKGALVKTLEKI